jgi:uncharacterized protein YndB with AHSA1/START domain
MSAETTAVPAAETDTADRELVLTRLFDAPRELVFDAYTDPKHIAEWWGPNGFSTTVYEMDVRPGGRWRFMMHGPDGKDWPNRIVYREVVRPERLEYEHGSDVDDDPERFQVTVTFTEEEGGTRLTSRLVLPTAEQRAIKVKFGAVELGQQTLDRFAAHLATR